jgi:hypothetical protein
MLLQGQKVENTLWWRFATPPDASDLELLGVNLFTWWSNSYAAIAPQALVLNEILITDMSEEEGIQFTRNGDGVNGEVSGDILPNNSSVCVSFRTGFSGRSRRGRNYVPGIPIGARDGVNTITQAYATAVTEAYTALIDSEVVSNAIWVIASRFSGVDPDTKRPIPRTEGVTTGVSAVVVTDLILDSQRRRLPGRGQ